MSLHAGDTMAVLSRIADAGNKIAKAISGSNGQDKRIAEPEQQLAEARADMQFLKAYSRLQEAQLAEKQANYERVRKDRAILLDVKTTEGLSASEWMMRTYTAEAKLSEAQARITELETELESHAWEISPAMAQAKIDQQAKRITELEGRKTERYLSAEQAERSGDR